MPQQHLHPVCISSDQGNLTPASHNTQMHSPELFHGYQLSDAAARCGVQHHPSRPNHGPSMPRRSTRALTAPPSQLEMTSQSPPFRWRPHAPAHVRASPSRDAACETLLLHAASDPPGTLSPNPTTIVRSFLHHPSIYLHTQAVAPGFDLCVKPPSAGCGSRACTDKENRQFVVFLFHFFLQAKTTKTRRGLPAIHPEQHISLSTNTTTHTSFVFIRGRWLLKSKRRCHGLNHHDNPPELLSPVQLSFTRALRRDHDAIGLRHNSFLHLRI
ncbi:hypothetical protein S40288_11023 [Stachybotrys chartarum IBT 40288]|nr:hypothetical protein S40288_11023 [Stachybotrys chartarum IBT 40288]